MQLLAMLTVDPWHWLDENGEYPEEHPRLWPKLNRIGQFVSAGCDLKEKHGRPTLVKCRTRGCGWSMWVALVPDSEALLAFCPGCHKEEMLIRNWQDTLWALERLDSFPVLE